jgi:hypothetical protein
MPVGISANTVDVVGNVRKTRMRSLLFLGIPIAILLAVVVGVWLAARIISPLHQTVISNEGYDYHFLFDKSAEPVNLVQGDGLQLDNRALVIAKPTSDNLIQDCGAVGRGWTQAFMVLIEGREQRVCTLDNKAFLAIFYHGTEKHLFEITYTIPQRDYHDLQTIFGSLKIERP